MEIKKEVKIKAWLMENDKMPTEAGTLYTINGDTFFVHKKHMDWGLRCVM